MISLDEGAAPYTIHAELTRVGSDFLCVLTGGTRPHIGAVCLAEPSAAVHPVTGRALAHGEAPRVRTLAGEGHKDAQPAELFARALCMHYSANVVCTAGIHVDGASPDEIAIMMENITQLLENLLKNKPIQRDNKL